MMEEREISGILSKLSEIEPSADYALRSRGAILAAPRLPRRYFGLAGIKRYIGEGVGFAVSIGLASITIVLLLINVPKALSPMIGNRLPGSDTAALVNDVDAAVKDIDIHLQEAQLFDTAAQKAGSALKETANGRAPHINQSLIQKESDGVAPQVTNTEPVNIDNILNELAK